METSERERSMPLGRLCAEAGVVCPREAEELIIRGVSADSRRIRPGWLFVAVNGMHTDGRQYIPAALQAGAVAVICQPLPEEGSSGERMPEGQIVLYADNIREAMARLFDAWYGHPGRRLRLVGITGTNGKTSVACMLRHILMTAGEPCGMIGTLGCFSPSGPVNIRSADERAAMTTPDPEELYAILARMAEEAADPSPLTVIMEVTSHALALEKVAPLSFELSVFTNLSPEHLDFHPTVEAYFKAKCRLFERSRLGVVNADDKWGRSLPAMFLPVDKWLICRTSATGGITDPVCPTGTCSRTQAGQIRSLGLCGVEYRLITPDVRLRIRCPVPGQFTVINSMQAAVAAMSLGVSPTHVKEALGSFPGVPGRMERVPLGPAYDGEFSVFIDFAHTPDALETLLETFHRLRQESGTGQGACGGRGRMAGYTVSHRTLSGAGRGTQSCTRRIVLLFGCGGDRDRSKRKAMARIASRMADVVVITSDNSRSEDPGAIIQDILTGIDKESEYVVISNRAEAIRHVILHARLGDIILLCGKGHETYEIDRTGRHPFCEREIVLSALRERG